MSGHGALAVCGGGGGRARGVLFPSSCRHDPAPSRDSGGFNVLSNTGVQQAVRPCATGEAESRLAPAPKRPARGMPARALLSPPLPPLTVIGGGGGRLADTTPNALAAASASTSASVARRGIGARCVGWGLPPCRRARACVRATAVREQPCRLRGLAVRRRVAWASKGRVAKKSFVLSLLSTLPTRVRCVSLHLRTPGTNAREARA